MIYNKMVSFPQENLKGKTGEFPCETFKILDEVIAVKSVVSCYKNS